jgi:hypothetical protein
MRRSGSGYATVSAMRADPRRKLDFATILDAKAFSEEDLACNRRGILSPRQDAWRLAHPKFVDDDGGDGTVEAFVGRVMIEGRYFAGRMGETVFAQLVEHGRRFSLPPGLERHLVRDAPYRAYAAYGWIWSIEPILEEELGAATSAVPTYRTTPEAPTPAGVARALAEALSIELSFTQEDVAANESGRFSPAQRAVGRRKLLSAVSRLVFSTVALLGFFALLRAGAPFPVFATLVGVLFLVTFWATSAWSIVDALARLLHPKPLAALARLDNDPTNRDNIVLRTKERPMKIKRAAIAIAEAPFSALRAWRFEVFFLPWTGSVVSVRPIPPSPSGGGRGAAEGDEDED